MSDFREGDLIEAVKGEDKSSTRFSGTLKSTGWQNGFILQAQGYEPEINWLETQGFTLNLIERAKPELPTEPGWYLDRLGSVWVHHDGKLNFVGEGGLDPHIYTPFTRLEPVPVTAKRVAEFITAWIDRVAVYNNEQLHAAVAAEFGSTDE